MQASRIAPLLLLATLGACEIVEPDSSDPVVVESDFRSGATDGWMVEFADYPPADEPIYELRWEVRTLPAPLDQTRHALFVSGSNRSDDLFMYLKRPVDGLIPGATYRARFEVQLASNAGSGCVGIGGAPGEAVYVKAGVTTAQPVRVLENGWYRVSIDKGNQSGGGATVATIGNVANGSDRCDAEAPYRLKTLTSEGHTLQATADDTGRLWLIVGTDSGFEGITSLYYTSIRATLERIG